jgi:hypothetical protein
MSASPESFWNDPPNQVTGVKALLRSFEMNKSRAILAVICAALVPIANLSAARHQAPAADVITMRKIGRSPRNFTRLW